MKLNKSIMFIMLLILFALSCFAIEIQQPYYHTLEAYNEFEVMWKISNICINDNSRRPNIVGAPERIIINGWQRSGIQTNTIIGLDSLSGNITWTAPGANGGEIITQGENLYRGTNGTVTVQSYNIKNGELLWRTRLPWTHGTSDLYLAENKIFVHTGDGEFFSLNGVGEILDTFHEDFRTFLVIDDVLYKEDNFSIKAIDFLSRRELWQRKLDSDYTYAPIFDNGKIFLSTFTSIYSIDQSTGKVNWQIFQDVLSNLYVAGDKIYFISENSHLVTVDQKTGYEISKVKFSPSFDLEKQNGEYFVSGDPTNNVLVVSFGDNYQIMGLKILNP